MGCATYLTNIPDCGFRYNPGMQNNFPPFSPSCSRPDAALTVSSLNRLVREILETGMPPVLVTGEISNLIRAASGHLYFTLKDEQAQIRCTMWRNRAQILPLRPESGMRVEVRAQVTLYEQRGDYQLNIETLRPAGVGSLYEAFSRLREKLAAEGLFDPDRRRPLPVYPRGVGIVTSPSAAALRDVLVTLHRRAPHLPVILYPSQVQGAEAPAQLVQALWQASQRSAADGVDLILLVRGGGGIEDLQAFNDEALARAIRACPVPVVAGIGHETDFTIADFAADLRTPTPTAAAELASTGFAAARTRLAALAAALGHAMWRYPETLAQRLDRSALRLLHPRQRLQYAARDISALARRLQTAASRLPDPQHARLERLALRLRACQPVLPREHCRLLAGRLAHAGHNLLQRRQERLDAFSAHLQHLAPQAVLARGYSITRDAAGNILHSARTVQHGDMVAIQLADGDLTAQITHASPPAPGIRRKK